MDSRRLADRPRATDFYKQRSQSPQERNTRGDRHRDRHHDDPKRRERDDHRVVRHHRNDRDTAEEKHLRSHKRVQTQHNSAQEASLPFGARYLSARSDLAAFEPLLAYYLEVQENISWAELTDYEVKGRWKSFVGKWNKGELAQGWYDADVFARAAKEWVPVPRMAMKLAGDKREDETKSTSLVLAEREAENEGNTGGSRRDRETDTADDDGSDGDEGDDYGPSIYQTRLPNSHTTDDPSSSRKPGPGIPNLQDLELRQEQALEAQHDQLESLRLARKTDRAEQKERLDDVLPPRADAGTHERRMEKKRALNEKLRSFRDPSPGGGEARDEDLMGGGGGGGGPDGEIAEYKRKLALEQRRKTEREIRREEVQRARMEERAERLKEYKEREDGAMSRLKELAKARFG